VGGAAVAGLNIAVGMGGSVDGKAILAQQIGCVLVLGNDMSSALPKNPLAPYAPSDKDPWNLAKVGHFYRRIAFGGNHDTLEAAVKLTPAQLVDEAMNYDPEKDQFNDMLESLTGFVDVKEPRSLQSWWIHRILNTEHPLQEKLALFWHDHFATSAAKVNQGDVMHRQIEMFRQMGLGNFRELLLATGRDAAMLIWLDGRESKKGKPNENYAREVMELFTLGIGNYTENDIKQLARCFTGWNVADGKGNFNPKQFDDGEKELFGKKGKFNDEQAVDLLLAQPAAPKYLARKLLFEFVHPNPDAALIDEVAALLVANKWELKPTLRTIFLSNVFYSDYAYRSRIKSPAELSCGLSLALGGKIKTEFVRDQMNRMGQSLLYPPNVKGWDGNEAWINSNTYLVRMNFGWAIAQQRGNDYAKKGSIDKILKSESAKSADDVVKIFVDLLADGNVPDETRAALVDYLNRDEKNKPRKFENEKHGGSSRFVKSVLRVVTTLPEFQLA
jgi:uncharacterized protein (DUF1800 family)